MVQQLTHGGLALQRLEFDFACLVVANHHLQIGKFRNMLADRVVEVPQTLLVQHHQGDAGDWLGHGVDAEEGVALHGALIFQGGIATGLEGGYLAILCQQPDHAGHIPIADDLLHGRVELLDGLGLEARRLSAVRLPWPAGVSRCGRNCRQGQSCGDKPLD